MAKRLKLIRKRQGITQEELGFRAGIHPKYVSEIECGARNPSLYILLKLASALEVPPILLITSDVIEFEYGYIVLDSKYRSPFWDSQNRH